uniref:Transcription activator GCR1-like domain-containing protein n=1 Tax=Odontella aurita TaxID=265563 RepID=A0A7S4N0Q2_9STRA|mmetsp:Transcript_43135/g.131406  ORF Transcript_43135/g.131406 Transcript_43135/m.131406 type:complete len:355 (+) Transcript_43135:37-1101(+)
MATMTTPIAWPQPPPPAPFWFPMPPSQPVQRFRPSPYYPDAAEAALIRAAHSVLTSFLATSLTSTSTSPSAAAEPCSAGEEEDVLGSSGIRADVLHFHFPFLDCGALAAEVRRRRRSDGESKGGGGGTFLEENEGGATSNAEDDSVPPLPPSPENPSAVASPSEAERLRPKDSDSHREDGTDDGAASKPRRRKRKKQRPLPLVFNNPGTNAPPDPLPARHALLEAQGLEPPSAAQASNPPPLPAWGGVADYPAAAATLSSRPLDLRTLWEEYEVGINGRKPARHFTSAERGQCKHVYSRRKIGWGAIDRMVRTERWTAEGAIEEIYRVYGQKTLNHLLLARRVDERAGGHKRLR